ncbi:hypothetical protein HanPI659440_Chr07g0272971 [Helianthus annuus]|nr:hypothetical protein HanPI659440_Chr07g0272971 [Helianthus annuus]
MCSRFLSSSRCLQPFLVVHLQLYIQLWQLSLYLTVHPHRLQKVPMPIYHFFRHRQRIEHRVFGI